MFRIPVQVALTWPIPNYVNPIRRSGLELHLLSAIFLCAAAVCVSSRLWSRVVVRRWFGLDDFFILLAFAFAVCVTGLVIIGTNKYNWDRHIWDMNPQVIERSMRTFYYCRIFWGQASCFIRLSVIVLYYRLLKTIQAPRSYFWIMHITLVYNLIIQLYYSFTGIFPCWPIYAYWAWPMVEARCINDGLSFQTAGVLNTFAEFELAFLPLVAVYRLQVQKQQRWGIISLLSLGCLVCLVGCFRCYYIWRSLETFDLSWYSAPHWICSEVENYLALICACAVPLRPLVGRTIRKFDKNMHSQSSDGSHISFGTNTINQTRTEASPDEVADWASMMRKIDIEGIADDGYGYTVTISGPPRPQRQSSMRFLKSITGNFLSARRKQEMAEKASQRMELMMKTTEIQVDQSARGFHEKRDRWGSMTTQSSDAISPTMEIDVFMPQYLGDPNMMTTETRSIEELSPTEQKKLSGTRFPYPDDSTEDVQALPEYPHPTFKFG